MSYEYSRNIRDSQKEVAVALAQAGANTGAIDLEQAIGGNIEGIVGQIDIPAVARTARYAHASDMPNSAPLSQPTTGHEIPAIRQRRPTASSRYREEPWNVDIGPVGTAAGRSPQESDGRRWSRNCVMGASGPSVERRTSVAGFSSPRPHAKSTAGPNSPW